MADELWTKGSRVTFKDKKIPLFLDQLAPKANKMGISVRVTSGYRSPADQARVVCNNYHNTGGANLSVYGSRTQGVYREHCPSRNMQPIVDYETAKLKAAMERDPNYQGHGTGYAVDLSVAKLTHSEKLEYKALIESMGAKVLWEKSPEHFHVWLKDWKPQNPFYNISNSIPVLVGVMTIGTGVGAFSFLKLKKASAKKRLPYIALFLVGLGLVTLPAYRISDIKS